MKNTKKNVKKAETVALRENKRASDTSRMQWIYALVIILSIIAIYGKSISYDFVYLDDNKFTEEYARYAEEDDRFIIPVGKTFGTDYYRPGLGYSFMFDAIIGGDNPSTYNISNIIMHITGSLLVFLALILMGFKPTLSFLLTMFFALHPILVPAVAWVAGRNDSLVAIFILASFIFLIKYLDSKNNIGYLILHTVLFSMSFLTKEIALFFPIVAIFYIYFIRKEKPSLNTYYMLIMQWLIIGFAWYFTRDNYLPDVPAENEMGIMVLLESLPTLLALIGKAFLPIKMIGFSNYEAFTIITGSIFTAILVGLPFTRFVKDKKMYVFGLLWFALFVLPTLIVRLKYSEDFFHYAEHRMYLPFFGLLVALAAVIKSFKFSKKTLITATIIISIAVGLRSYFYINHFDGRKAYWSHHIDMYPQKARGYINLAKAYLSDRNFDSAIELHKKAHQLNPNSVYLNTDMSYVYLEMGDFEKSEFHAKQALALEPRDAIANYNLGKSYARRNMWAEAAAAYENALSSNASAGWYTSLATAYYNLQQYKEAIAASQKALKINGRDIASLQNIAASHFSMGNESEALKYWDKGLAIDSNNIQILNNLTKFYIMQESIETARLYFDEVKRKGGKVDPQVSSFFKRLDSDK